MHLHNVFDTDDEAALLYKLFLRKRDKILTDNIVFFLHYHVTAALFFLGCIIVVVAMFILDPIDCIADTAVDDVIDNYCLYHSTYTIKVGELGDAQQYLVPHPGISPISDKSSGKRFHRYYLWVGLLLVIQGASFYIPRGIWKHFEGSTIHNILEDKGIKNKAFESATNKNPDDKTQPESRPHRDTDEQREGLLKESMGENSDNGEDPSEDFKCLLHYILSKSHTFYYWKLLGCEFLNLANVFLQLYVMNIFVGFGLSKENFWYNENILELFLEARPFQKREVVEQIFPKISACTFYSYGPSGNVINYEAVCVLPINAVNEKVYASLYVWLLFLISVSVLAVLYRLLLLIPFVRNRMLKFHVRSEELTKYNISISRLRKRLSFGNWQILLQLTGNSNMDSGELTDIVKHLCRKREK